MTNSKNNLIRLGFKRRRRRWLIMTMLLLIITSILAALMMILGNINYSPSTVLRVLLGDNIKGASFAINTLRLPRMLAGVMVGVAFGMAGNTFQTMLRNPLASPDIIGVTSGASVAAVFCILVLNISGNMISIIAVISGLLVAGLIYMLSQGGSFSGGRLILIGIGIQAMLNSCISFLLLRANQYDVPAAIRWLNGSLNGIQMKSIPGLFFVLIIFGTILIILGRHLMILELGDQSAITLGLNTDRIRLLLVMSSVFLIAFATAVTGPVSFVAFLAGPIATKLVGTGNSNVIPSGLVGAILVLGADLLGQFAFDTRFPVGVITGILGAPYLMFLLVRMNRKGGAA